MDTAVQVIGRPRRATSSSPLARAARAGGSTAATW